MTTSFVDRIISTRLPILYFSILLSFPSLLLYVAETVTVIRHKKYHKTFFVIFAARAVVVGHRT
jgi:hypothetical protein